MQSKLPIVTVALTIIIIAVFILQQIFNLDNFAFVPAYAFSRPWTFITAIFLHANYLHIFLNLFALVMFGSYFEFRVSKKVYLLIFFLGGILGNVGFLLTATDPTIAGIGASGAIYGVMGALAILVPYDRVFVFGIPMPMIAALFLWTALEVFGVFFPSGNIASIAHVFGLASGVAFGLYLRQRNSKKIRYFFEDF